jgi:plastocyanin
VLLILAATGPGCGSEHEPPPPDPSVFTAVQVVPDTATLFTVSPGTSVRLQALAKDQYGQTLDDPGPVQFSGGDEAVASVGQDGTVTAVGPGAVAVTATMSSDEVTASGSATVTVRVPPPTATVQTTTRRFQPEVVDVAAGGSVTWVFGETRHDVIFSSPDAPENIQPTQNASVSRQFPTKNDFSYRCLIHTGMTGRVRVH